MIIRNCFKDYKLEEDKKGLIRIRDRYSKAVIAEIDLKKVNRKWL